MPIVHLSQFSDVYHKITIISIGIYVPPTSTYCIQLCNVKSCPVTVQGRLHTDFCKDPLPVLIPHRQDLNEMWHKLHFQIISLNGQEVINHTASWHYEVWCSVLLKNIFEFIVENQRVAVIITFATLTPTGKSI